MMKHLAAITYTLLGGEGAVDLSALDERNMSIFTSGCDAGVWPLGGDKVTQMNGTGPDVRHKNMYKGGKKHKKRI